MTFKNEYIALLHELSVLAQKNEVIHDGSYLHIVQAVDNSIEHFEEKVKAFPDEITDFLKISSSDDYEWSVNFNKSFLETNHVTFFVSEANFVSWLDEVAPYSSNSFFNKSDNAKHIFIYGLSESYLGSKLCIHPTSVEKVNENDFLPSPLPDNKLIRQYTYVISTDLVIEPANFLLDRYTQAAWSRTILNYCVALQAICLAQELPSQHQLVIRGIKRVEFINGQSSLSFDELVCLQKNLTTVLEWVFEERTHTRMKLICDRLSLDLNPEQSFIDGLHKHLTNAFDEAKDKYGFIITEKSDEYNRELRSLQLQIFERTKTYSEKLRSLLSGVLRDSLAAIFLVAFGLFVRSDVSKLSTLVGNPNIILLFKGLSIYFLFSIVFQSVLHFTDIGLSKEEIRSFAKTTRNYLREDQISKMISVASSDRELIFAVLYAVIASTYLILAYVCWNIKAVASILGIS